MQLLDTVLRRWPELAAAWVARGMSLASHERYPEARQALETAATLGARSPEALAHLADAILRTTPTDTGAAASAIQRALRLAPGDAWMQNLAAQIHKGAAPRTDDVPDPRRLFQLRPPKEW
jgi:Flp pilus assembly protein TadD